MRAGGAGATCCRVALGLSPPRPAEPSRGAQLPPSGGLEAVCLVDPRTHCLSESPSPVSPIYTWGLGLLRLLGVAWESGTPSLALTSGVGGPEERKLSSPRRQTSVC